MKYSVRIGDPGGIWGTFDYPTWADALVAAVGFARRFGNSKKVVVINQEMYDYNWNGLSERQEYILERCGV